MNDLIKNAKTPEERNALRLINSTLDGSVSIKDAGESLVRSASQGINNMQPEDPAAAKLIGMKKSIENISQTGKIAKDTVFGSDVEGEPFVKQYINYFSGKYKDTPLTDLGEGAKGIGKYIVYMAKLKADKDLERAQIGINYLSGHAEKNDNINSLWKIIKLIPAVGEAIQVHSDAYEKVTK
jgi:hypothetical protein